MIAKLDDGRVFKTDKILKIEFDDTERVYKYKMITETMNIKSSERHKWLVWDKELKNFDLIEMKKLDKNKHELLMQN